MARQPRVVSYATITIAGTSGTIIGLGSITKTGAMKSFAGVLETAQVRARGDGTAATATEGVVIEIGSNVYLSEAEFEYMQFIRTGGTSGVLKGHFYDVEVAALLGLGH